MSGSSRVWEAVDGARLGGSACWPADWAGLGVRDASAEATGPGSSATGRTGGWGARYLLREKLLSIGDDFWIENDQGERIFRVDAKVLRVRDTVLIKDRDGNELVKLQKRLLRARESYGVAVAPGQDDALVLAITVYIDHLVD
jgi:uncharacterized protein YxjI